MERPAFCLSPLLQLLPILKTRIALAVLLMQIGTLPLLAQQVPLATQDLTAVSILRDVISQSALASIPLPISITGTIQLWAKQVSHMPFTLAVHGSQSLFSTTLPEGPLVITADGDAVTRARGATKVFQTPKSANALWLFYLPQLAAAVSSSGMSVSLLGTNEAKGGHTAVVAIKETSLGTLRPRVELEDDDATYFEIDTSTHDVLAISNCGVPLDESSVKYCRMHRTEFSNFVMDHGLRIPHTITEMVGLSVVNSLTITGITVQIP